MMGTKRLQYEVARLKHRARVFLDAPRRANRYRFLLKRCLLALRMEEDAAESWEIPGLVEERARAAEELWQILEGIETFGSYCKNDATFRERVLFEVGRRKLFAEFDHAGVGMVWGGTAPCRPEEIKTLEEDGIQLPLDLSRADQLAEAEFEVRVRAKCRACGAEMWRAGRELRCRSCGLVVSA